MDVHSEIETGLAAIEADAFRQAMRQLPGGVCIITAGTGNDRTGMTVTSVSSLSVEPPSVIVSIGRQSSTWRHLQQYGAFGISMLGAAQQPIADRFAGVAGVAGEARFSGASWFSLVTGAPLLAGALGCLDCVVEEMIERHSHAIVIGRVKAARIGDDGKGLVYWRGRYDNVGL